MKESAEDEDWWQLLKTRATISSTTASTPEPKLYASPITLIFDARKPYFMLAAPKQIGPWWPSKDKISVVVHVPEFVTHPYKDYSIIDCTMELEATVSEVEVTCDGQSGFKRAVTITPSLEIGAHRFFVFDNLSFRKKGSSELGQPTEIRLHCRISLRTSKKEITSFDTRKMTITYTQEFDADPTSIQRLEPHGPTSEASSNVLQYMAEKDKLLGALCAVRAQYQRSRTWDKARKLFKRLLHID